MKQLVHDTVHDAVRVCEGPPGNVWGQGNDTRRIYLLILLWVSRMVTMWPFCFQLVALLENLEGSPLSIPCMQVLQVSRSSATRHMKFLLRHTSKVQRLDTPSVGPAAWLAAQTFPFEIAWMRPWQKLSCCFKLWFLCIQAMKVHLQPWGSSPLSASGFRSTGMQMVILYSQAPKLHLQTWQTKPNCMELFKCLCSFGTCTIYLGLPTILQG